VRTFSKIIAAAISKADKLHQSAFHRLTMEEFGTHTEYKLQSHLKQQQILTGKNGKALYPELL
jgi:hypothetical protein